MSTTPLPFNEPFGDNIQSTGCDSRWYNDCEAGWDGVGQVNSIALVQHSSTGDYALEVKPNTSTSAFNGVSQAFVLGTSQTVTVDLTTHLTGHANNPFSVYGNVRVTWLDSSNSAIGFETKRLKIDGENWAGKLLFHAAAGARYVQVEIGYNEPSATYDEDDNAIHWPIGTIIGSDVYVPVCLAADLGCYEVDKNGKKPVDCSCSEGMIQVCECEVAACSAVTYCECVDGYGTSDPSLDSSDPTAWDKDF